MWVAMSQANPDLRFRVVSKDPRSKQLADALPDGVAEVMEVESAAEVIAALRGCAAGFILRRESVASAASWPVKLGEYLAASVPVVALRWPWDVADVIDREACGLLLDPARSNQRNSEVVLAWLGSPEHQNAVARSWSVAAEWSDRKVSQTILDLLPAG
jgi:glycosyltransferase involved in cell wall biosynthesis